MSGSKATFSEHSYGFFHVQESSNAVAVGSASIFDICNKVEPAMYSDESSMCPAPSSSPGTPFFTDTKSLIDITSEVSTLPGPLSNIQS